MRSLCASVSLLQCSCGHSSDSMGCFFNKEKACTVMLFPPHLTFPKPDHSHFCVFNLLPDMRHEDVAVLTTSFADGLRWTPAGLAKGSSAKPGGAGKVAHVPRAACSSRTCEKVALWRCSLKNLHVALHEEGRAPGRVSAPFWQCVRIAPRSRPPTSGCWQWQGFPRAAFLST